MSYRLDPSLRRQGETPIVMAPNMLTPDLCRQVIALGSTLPTIDGRISGTTLDHSLRLSTIRWVPHGPAFAGLYEAIGTALFNLNQAYFGFDLTTMEDMQFTTYVGQAQGFYDWHPDELLNARSHVARKLSMTLQLSDPADYDGGELELWFDNEAVQARREQGLGVLFPAPTLHRVRPITRGTRHSLVAWVSGPRFR